MNFLNINNKIIFKIKIKINEECNFKFILMKILMDLIILRLNLKEKNFYISKFNPKKKNFFSFILILN